MILVFDTSGPQLIAALGHSGRVETRIEDMARGQAERLMPMLSELIAAHNATWSDITAIGVGTGPGNFTGLRISIAAARGLALGLSIPAVGLSAFDVMDPTNSEDGALVVPAPRAHIYLRQAASQNVLHCPEADCPKAHINWVDVPLSDRLARMVTLTRGRMARYVSAPAPLYVKPADAAPARDAPPELIDG